MVGDSSADDDHPEVPEHTPHMDNKVDEAPSEAGGFFLTQGALGEDEEEEKDESYVPTPTCTSTLRTQPNGRKQPLRQRTRGARDKAQCPKPGSVRDGVNRSHGGPMGRRRTR